MIKNTLKSNKYFNFIYRRIFFPNLSQPEKDIYYLRKLNFDYSLDIGANVGTYSIELSKISKKVIAFEPIKKIFKCTKEYLPKNVILNNFALGNCTKKQKIFTPLQKNSNAEYALSSIKNKPKYYVAETITTKKFDIIFKRKNFLDKIDFIKIDTEGYEYEIILGMKQFLKKNNPIFLIEIEKKHNKRFKFFFLLMKNLGYKVCIFDNEKKFLKNLDFKFFLNKKLNINFNKKFGNNFWFIRY
jgi:FkbM family methyltransferase